MPRTKKAVADSSKVVLYRRVSTDGQADSGGGLEAQHRALMAEVERRGWTVVADLSDAGISGKSIDRPAMTEALRLVESGEAGTLVVSKLDRATRSLKDFADLMQRAQKGRWNFVALDLGIDLSSPSGEFMASVMASAAQWERRIISQRTSDVLQAKKAQGQRLGRPSGLSSEVVARIVKERTAGQTWQAIAAGLHADGITASRGGTTWYPSSVKAVYDSAAPSLRSA